MPRVPRDANLVDLGGISAFVLQASASFVDSRRGGGYSEINPGGERGRLQRRLDLPEQAPARLLAEGNGR